MYVVKTFSMLKTRRHHRSSRKYLEIEKKTKRGSGEGRKARNFGGPGRRGPGAGGPEAQGFVAKVGLAVAKVGRGQSRSWPK